MNYIEHLRTIIKKYGDRAALVDKKGCRTTSYKELYLLSCKVANKIKVQATMKGTPVMVCMDRQMEYIASYLGIIMAGCAVVPLVPEYPQSRIDHIKADCKAGLIISNDFFDDINSYEAAEYPEPDENSDSLIIYTSGSTGKAKGIVHTYKSISSITERNLSLYEIGTDLIFAAIAPLSFVAMLGEYLMPFLLGGTVHMLDNEIRKDASKLADYYKDNHITMGFISPQLLKVFKNRSTELKRILTGSERLSNVKYDDFEIVNVYASSEIGVSAAYFSVDKKYDNTPIGKPSEGLTFYVLDEDGNELDDGEEGELCVKGCYVKEYLNKPEETKKAFIKCEDGSALVHTGDIVKRLPDGNYLYVNRKDWLVKINGQRVETLEIELLISEIEGIFGAVVKAFTDRDGQNYLVAYYAADRAMENDIKNKISQNLPDYMMPRFITKLESIPVNSNGKVDRLSLLPPLAEDFKAEYAAPTTDAERKICDAFESILQCGRVGIMDDFYALGGDSIKVISLAAMLEDMNVSPQLILKNRTAKELAAALKNAKADESWQKDESRTEYPLSAAEKAMYIEQMLDSESVQYNLNTTIVVEGSDADTVKKAIEKVMGMHEAFRSYYANKNGTPIRVLTGEIPEIESFDADSAEAAMSSIKAFNPPFDLSTIPVKVRLYRTDAGIFVQLLMHHIMIDGEGINIIVKELADTLAGRDVKAAGYDLSYCCENSNKNADRHMEYYRELFKDGVPVNEMPVKAARPKVHPMSDTMLDYGIDSYQCSRLRECARKINVTLFELLLGAAAMAVGKYCASEDVVLGVPKNTRDGKTSKTVGMFINTLPVRIRPQRDMPVKDYFCAVSDSLRGTLSNSDCSFESIVDEFCPQKDLSRHPVFDVGVNMLATSFKYNENGTTVRLICEYQKMGRDINLFFENEGDEMKLTLMYSSLLFDKTVIENLADLLMAILSRIAADTDLTVRQASELTGEQKEIIDGFSPKQDDDYGIQLLHKRFEAQVLATPDNIAVIAVDREYTYKELDEDSDKVANSLMDRGFSACDSAVVMLKRTSKFFAAILGVLKAGGSYIPTDPAYPADRIQSVLQDSESRFVITDEYSDKYTNCVTIDELLHNENSAKPCVSVTPDDLAYMIYTSGSTGKPKGVMIEHKSICNYLRIHESNIFPYLVAHKVSRFMTVTTVAFDMSIKEIYSPLLSGKTLVFADEEAAADPGVLVEWFRKTGADGFNGTPSRVEQYLYVDGFEDAVKNLKMIGCGGEKYSTTLLSKLKTITDAVILNSYGPTEITISSNVAYLNDNNISVGRPQLNVKEFIVDAFGDELPVGVMGELYIGGMGVARGYNNLEEMTAERFVEYKGMRVYKSGDYAKWTPDGNVVIFGRKDNQVKLRGFRIELGEIESLIAAQPGIKKAVVLIKTLNGQDNICAYFTADRKIDINELREELKKQLTHYMIPTAFMQLDTMPETQNGKIDMKSLPEPKENKIKTADVSVYDNIITRKIKEILTQITGVTEFINTEDLIGYGLNSLGIIRLVIELNKEFSISLAVRDLRDGCTIAGLEEMIIVNYMSGRNQQLSEKAEKEVIDSCPLSSSQFGVYSECMKNPYTTTYNIPIYYTFPKETDIGKLTKAVRTVLDAHPYIFTTITIEGDDIVQKRAVSTAVDIPVHDLDDGCLDKFKNEFCKPFSLMNKRLFRIEIVKTDKAVYLFTDFHHIIFDGGSGSIFIKQLKDVLEGRQIDKESYDYFDFVTDTDTEGETYKASEKYISELLQNCEGADAITPDLGGLPENGKAAMVSIPVNMTEIKEFCTEHKITAAHLFLAAVFYTVSRFTNSHNAYISTISNGRANIKLKDSFGMFVNTMPLGIEIGDISAVELTEQCKDIFNRAVDNEMYPFAKVASKYNYSTDIFFAYQLGVKEEIIINNETITSTPVGERMVKFKTGIYIENNNGVDCIDIVFNDAQYSYSLMNTLASCIKAVVYNIIADPQQPVRKLSMLDKDSSAFVEKVSSTKLEKPQNELLHRMFEKQVEQNPDHKALVAVDGEFSYRELDDRANRVANALIEKGVKTGSNVVLLLERKSAYFAALLGVLKAGGTFIPSCPDYPKERIENIIEDSEADYIISFGEFLNMYDKALDIEELERSSDKTNPMVEVNPENLAYMIYTSGSTGKPKGVMLKHKGIANYLTDSEYNPQIHLVKKNCRCYGSVTTVSFDMNFKETMGALCNGLTLVFAGDEMTQNPILLGEFFQKNNVDAFNATVSRLLTYMEVPEFAKAMQNCKVILSGGEKYSDKLLSVLREKTNARILNTYGPTEVTVSSNVADLTDAQIITVGKPLYNYIEYVVDADDNKLPANVVGELIIGGVGVGKGYRKLPEKTKEAFISYEGQPFYRSGDYARWTDNGELVILGRKDNQVKIRGLRIELGEIEKVLTSIKGIRSGIVMIRKLRNEDVICAYYTADRAFDENELKEIMAQKLTAYMVPAFFVQMDEMPLTANGKINTKALAEPQIKNSSKKIEKPVSEAEKAFCDIFCRVLGLDSVSVTDNFFDLGGSSLSVTNVVIQASKSNYHIAFRDVFANSTPRALAKLVDADHKECLNPFGRIDDYDYSGINRVLSENTLSSFLNGKMQKIGNVILSGGTGFLGIHILNKLLTDYDSKIYCLLRNSESLPAERRLKSIYYYYFDEDVLEKYKGRIEIIPEDITKLESLENFTVADVDTFINCAANVKHFSAGTDIEDVNYYGVKNILEFCKRRDIRLIHVSTMSIGGAYIGEKGMTDCLKEDMLYIGQTLSSKYTNSKYLAEREILNAVANGFNAKIMRVGTLSARDKDGEYQINFKTNNFTGRIKSAYVIGAYPYNNMTGTVEFSPIDSCADAILRLAGTPKECVVFHPYNNHMHIMEEIYTAMNEIGLNTMAADSETYAKRLEAAKEDPQKAEVLSSFMAYERIDGRKVYSVSKSNEYTMQVLYRLGFCWPVTSLDYIKQFLVALKTLGYFDI